MCLIPEDNDTSYFIGSPIETSVESAPPSLMKRFQGGGVGTEFQVWLAGEISRPPLLSRDTFLAETHVDVDPTRVAPRTATLLG